MFIGAINATVRKFLGNVAPSFAGRRIVVGCSGNFTSEGVLARYAPGVELHSNDVSFYSCLVGRWLMGEGLPYRVLDEDYAFLREYQGDPTTSVASIAVLMDMLQFHKRGHPHAVRMWNAHRDTFPELVGRTLEKLEKVQIPLASFYAGDVFRHFERFADDPRAVFCCYAPTYKGGYERLYDRLYKVLEWDPPQYDLLDDAARDRLIQWMTERSFVWYDDRLIPGMTPVMQHQSGYNRTVYLYSNVIERPSFFGASVKDTVPNWRLVGPDLKITPKSRLDIVPITTEQLYSFKESFLGKGVMFSAGLWAFALTVDGQVFGFLEYDLPKGDDRAEMYLQADFAVPGTPYDRLSKLVVMCALSREARRAVERKYEQRVRTFYTQAFTKRPVSMKYRGLLELVRRATSKEGLPYLGYRGTCTDRTLEETLRLWLQKHT